jgi:predicted N-acyltransferase
MDEIVQHAFISNSVYKAFFTFYMKLCDYFWIIPYLAKQNAVHFLGLVQKTILTGGSCWEKYNSPDFYA